ncbi:MAG: hypothetical protein QM804_04080 [Propionicimonas sp.]
MPDDPSTAEPAELEGFYFLVGQRDPTYYGFVWRIWSRGTSFYVKARSRQIGDFKISIHGPDPRPGLRPGFKIDQDHSTPQAHYRVADPDAVPYWFTGWELPNGMTKVVRIAVPADTFLHPSARFGPPAGSIAPGMIGGIVDAPPDGYFAALDLYVASERPDWAGRANAESQNAIAGELRNESGQFLIGLTAHIKLVEDPLPAGLLTHDAELDETEVTRGVATAPDERGFMWLCERLFSERSLRVAGGEGGG